jgi:AcrR family transcriptional regulator
MPTKSRAPRRVARDGKGRGGDLRVRLDVDERRAQLLELGLNIFGSSDYESISIDDIAAKAGMSKGLLYHYFASKRGFYVAVIRHAAENLRASIDPGKEVAPLERVEIAIKNYLDFVDDHSNAYVPLMRSGIGSDPEVYEIVEDTRLDLLKLLIEGMGATSPPPLVRLALRSWIGCVEAAALEWLDKKHVDRDVIVRLMRDMLVHAVVVATQLSPPPSQEDERSERPRRKP